VCEVASLLAGLLKHHFAADARSDQELLLERLSNYCNRPMLSLNDTTSVEEFKPYLWDFLNSMLFVITVVTTVGKLHSCRRSVLTFYENVGDCQTVRGRGYQAN
jgi:hypothetical protein